MIYYQDDAVTLHLGDCLIEAAWLDADVLVTDPPYGIAREQKKGRYYPEGRKIAPQIRIRGAVISDDSTDARDAVLAEWGTKPAVVFGSWRATMPAETKHRLIWYKKMAAPGPRHLPWFPAEEEIYILGAGFTGNPEQNVLVTNEIRFGATGAVALAGHPTPKPVPLMESLIQKCPPGVIADPFAGSGSTLVAAKRLGRRAIGVEIEERYCEIAARRLSQGVLDFGDAS